MAKLNIVWYGMRLLKKFFREYHIDEPNIVGGGKKN